MAGQGVTPTNTAIPLQTIPMIPPSSNGSSLPLSSTTAQRTMQSIFQPVVETSGPSSLCHLDTPHLECQNGGLCKMGKTDLSQFDEYGSVVPMPIKLYQSKTFDISKHVDGMMETMHCECPLGYTGFFCEIMVDVCSIEGDGLEPHYCFNGGLCDMDEFSAEYICDCSPNGSVVGSGNSCENKVTSHCPMRFMEETDNFCTNFGTCNDPEGKSDFSSVLCNCLPGFIGTHCDIVSEVRYPFSSDAAIVFQSSCPITHELECLNGGICELGPTNYGIFQPELPESLSLPSMNGMHCKCPSGYTGALCEIEVELCGETNDYACFHGSVCTPFDPSDPNGYECICQGFHMQFQTPAAGKACQYLLTESCELDNPLSDRAYCTNNGECIEMVGAEEPHKGCHCPLEFTGPKCEYPKGSKEALEYDGLQDQPPPPITQEEASSSSSASSLPFGFTENEVSECPTPGSHRLVCGRFGKCRVGEKPQSIYAGLDPATMDWLNQHLSNDDPETDGGMYCQCAEGYVGNYCELKLEVCGEGEHICLQGGACVKDGLTEQEEKYSCACTLAGQTPTVGGMCEFIAETSCTLEEEFGDHSFCTNGGECIDIVGRYENHAGCNCPPGFKGAHCEIVEGLQFDDAPKPPVEKPVVVNIADPTDEDEVIFSETFHAEETRDPSNEECPTPGKHKLICGPHGKCRVGEKPKDLYAGLDAETMEWLNKHLANDDPEKDGGMYCQCAEGFAGNYCELKLEVCGEGEHICFGGGACVENDLTEQEEKYSCACKRVGEKPTVGKMCEFVAQQSCDLEEKFSYNSFCVNGGTCKDVMHEFGTHAQCDCPEGYKGTHCEIVAGLQFDKDVDNDEEFPIDEDSLPSMNESEESDEDELDPGPPETSESDPEPEPVDEPEPEPVDEPESEPVDEPDLEPEPNPVQDDDFAATRPTKDPSNENQQSSNQGSGNKANTFDTVKKELKSMHIVGLVFAILALVLFPIFIFVSRRSFQNQTKQTKSRNPVDLNLDADGGNMPPVFSDESTANGSTSTGMDTNMTQDEKDQTIV